MSHKTKLLLQILFLFIPSLAFKSFRRDPMEYRLPNDTVPLNYTLRIVADPKTISFDGHTSIRIRALHVTDQIVLHSKNLSINQISVKDSRGDAVQISNFNHTVDDRDFLTINLADELIVGDVYDLDFGYSAPFGELKGFYTGSYVDDGGNRRYFASTQAKPTFSRSIYPCYDEPPYKASFKIHIHHPQEYRAISNMDQIESDLPAIEGYGVTTFRPTPPMSTHLVAFVISDFEYRSNIVEGEILYPREYRVYARPGAQLDYPLGFGQRSLQYLQGYADSNYRLPKIDNVALPEYNGLGENWGLITYREEILLNENNGSDIKTQVATLMSRGQAHFWFGNEVTPKWWDYAWLSEGFATFFGFYTTEKVYNGEWRVMEQFVVNEMHNVMLPDALPTAKPMTNIVGSPDEIQVNFNNNARIKAASVIRMMQNVLGDAVFRLSLVTYLKNLSTGVSDPQILFDEMQKIVGQTNVLPTNTSVGNVFNMWTTQAGYPILYAERVGESYVQISQKRFYTNESLSSDEKWWIPMTWTTQSNPEFENTTTQLWLIPILASLTTPIGKEDDWFIFNKQQSGYYRVMYDVGNWNKLSYALNSENHTIIHPLNKAQLIDDASIFSQTGRLSYNVTFDLLNYLDDELDWIPWSSAEKAIAFLNIRMPASDQYNLYKTFLVSKSKKAYESVGLSVNEADGYPIRRMRTLLGKISCEAGSEKCMQDAKDILNRSLSDDLKVDSDVKPVVYCYGVRGSDEATWWSVFNQYVNASKRTEVHYFIRGLCCSEDEVVIDRFLNMTIDEMSLVRKQDGLNIVRTIIFSGQLGIERVLNFMINNYLIMRNSYVQNASVLIQDLGSYIITDLQLELFQRFTETYENEFTTSEIKLVEQTWLKIDQNTAWKRQFIEEIDTWLIENVSN